MDYDPRFNILSAEFDPTLLLNESDNVPLDHASDRFYSSLLCVISEETLRVSLRKLHDCKTVVGRLSHAVYLLPWRSQPLCLLEDYSPDRSSSSTSQDRGAALRSCLQGFVRRAKGEAEATRDLLSLRLIGYTAVRNTSYEFLREAWASRQEIAVCLQPSPYRKALHCRGYILLFDRGSNLVLSDVKIEGGLKAPFMWISCKSIRSISYG